MNEQTSGSVEEDKSLEKSPGREQLEYVTEPQAVKEEPGRGVQQCWEAQWQEFLKSLQAPCSAWGNPQLSETAPWDDAKTFLASFEQVAEACRWPRGEWVARLMPALSGEAQQAFSLLEARDKEDYGKVKAAILRGDALRREMQRQHFRQFCCQELEDPRRMYSRLQELCCRWLKPDRHTKEQILELLVLEQFLASLPVDVQGWVRAGGPDSCAQAVALLEDFLVSRRGAETEKCQEPSQEWPLGLPDVKEEPLDVVQGEISEEHAEIFQDTKQNVDGEVTLPGAGIAHPALLLPPEGQDVAEAEQTKALGIQVDQGMKPRKMGAPVHVVERTLKQSSQRTMFWQVQQEDGKNVDSLERSLGPRPQLGFAPHPVKKEEMFLPDPGQSVRLPGQESGDGKGTQLKVKNSQVGGNEPQETPRRGRGKTHQNVKTEVEEERCESNSRQGMEPLTGCKESGELPEGLGAACSNPSSVDTEGGKASFSRCASRCHLKSGLVMEHSGEMCNEETNHECPEFGVRLHSNSLAKHQRIHSGEKTYKCPDCRKSFSKKAYLLRHQKMHTGKNQHPCPQCGKKFSWRSDLVRHEIIHTGEKPHKCSDCGKSYTHRSNLLRHCRSHTGKKPRQCPECGKKFSQRSQFLNHQNLHTGEKPHKYSDCGKTISS